MNLPSLSIRRSGFTLLETLVALVIVVTVLAGAATINQSMLKAGQVSEDQAQANALAEETVGLVKILQRSGGGGVSNGTIFTAPNQTDPVAQPYQLQTCQGSNCSSQVIPWCGSTNCGTTSFYSTNRTNDEGEIVAVRRNNAFPNQVMVVSMLTDRNGTALANLVPGDWDFYRRKISATEVTVTNLVTGLQVKRSL